jgi:hypothetical protein
VVLGTQFEKPCSGGRRGGCDMTVKPEILLILLLDVLWLTIKNRLLKTPYKVYIINDSACKN